MSSSFCSFFAIDAGERHDPVQLPTPAAVSRECPLPPWRGTVRPGPAKAHAHRRRPFQIVAEELAHTVAKTPHNRWHEPAPDVVCPIDAPEPGCRIEETQRRSLESLPTSRNRGEVVDIPDAPEHRPAGANRLKSLPLLRARQTGNQPLVDDALRPMEEVEIVRAGWQLHRRHCTSSTSFDHTDHGVDPGLNGVILGQNPGRNGPQIVARASGQRVLRAAILRSRLVSDQT
jgi:hypothetical protein